MAAMATTFSSMLDCNGLCAIQTQKSRKVKAMACLNVSSMKGGVLGKGVEALIQKGCKTISKSRATSIHAAADNGGASSTNLVGKEEPQPGFGHLWTQCNSCYGLNYKKHLSAKMFICEHCGEYLKMSSSDRIDFLIEPSSWTPLDEDMIFVDTYGFESQKSAKQRMLALENENKSASEEV